MSLFILSDRKWPDSLRLTAVLSLLILVALIVINRFLLSDAAPRGMISFQLAATPEHAAAILESWSHSARVWARTSLYVDFVFIAVYLLFLLKLTGHWLLDRPGVREQQVGRWTRNLFCTAAATDVGENISLLMVLEQPRTDFWPMAATLLALVKFSCLMAGAGGLLVVRAARGQPLRT